MNSNISKFLNKQNLKLLLDVLLDELRIDTNNKTVVTNIRTVFESNINPFTSNANKTPHLLLVDLNKQFLSQVVIAVNRLFPNLKKEQEFKRINITSEEVLEPYKVEDIHSARQDNFEKQVLRKRLEFEKSINLNKPPELDFSEKMDDGKIKEMDNLIAETIARRKFDIEQIQPKTTSDDSENWTQRDPLQQINKNNIQKKKVSWTENKLTNNMLQEIIIDDNQYNQDNISMLVEEQLSPITRLKSIVKNDAISNNFSNSLDNSLNIFNKIKKVKDVKLDTNVMDTNVMNTNAIDTNAIDTNAMNESLVNELNKKYDELNSKVDILIEQMNKLTKHFEI